MSHHTGGVPIGHSGLLVSQTLDVKRRVTSNQSGLMTAAAIVAREKEVEEERNEGMRKGAA